MQIVTLALAVAAPWLPATAPAAEPVRPADAFVDAIGVNVHPWGLYESRQDVLAAKLAEAGIRHVRDGAVPFAFKRAGELYAAHGIRTMLLCGRRKPGPWPQLLDEAGIDAARKDQSPPARPVALAVGSSIGLARVFVPGESAEPVSTHPSPAVIPLQVPDRILVVELQPRSLAASGGAVAAGNGGVKPEAAAPEDLGLVRDWILRQVQAGARPKVLFAFGSMAPAPAELLAADAEGVRVKTSGVAAFEMSVAWAKATEENLYQFGLPLAADAPPAVGVAILRLGWRLGHEKDDAYRACLGALKRRDPAAAEELEGGGGR